MASAASTQKLGANASYTFTSQPRALEGTRKKFRDPAATQDLTNNNSTGNMMFDRRIVRGSTIRQSNAPAAMNQPDPIELQKQQETLRRKQARAKAATKMRPTTPEAVSGRKHTDVQTELYLEELTDRVETETVQVQTDAFLDRPPSPLFIPIKSGLDVATQIVEGDLFDFDTEVKPILEVLIGKTLEQALMEVKEEEELARLRDHQQQFEELRDAELAETQRQEEEARRRHEEKNRRMKEQREALQKEKETAEKIAARAFAQSYLAGLVPSVFSSLSQGGYFYDTQEREIESQFLPWLMDGVEAKLSTQAQARAILDSMILSVIRQQRQDYGLADSSASEAEPTAPSSASDAQDPPVTEAPKTPSVSHDDSNPVRFEVPEISQPEETPAEAEEASVPLEEDSIVPPSSTEDEQPAETQEGEPEPEAEPAAPEEN